MYQCVWVSGVVANQKVRVYACLGEHGENAIEPLYYGHLEMGIRYLIQ